MSKFENTTPAIKPERDAGIKSTLEQAAEAVRELMRLEGYDGYTVTITADSIVIDKPQGIYPQPPKQEL